MLAEVDRSTLHRRQLTNARIKENEAFINLANGEFSTNIDLKILRITFLNDAEIGNRTWSAIAVDEWIQAG